MSGIFIQRHNHPNHVYKNHLFCKIFSYLLSVFGTKFGKLFLGDKCGVWVRIHAEEFLEKAKKIWGKEYRKDS